jgi:ligand-binding sensor protein
MDIKKKEKPHPHDKWTREQEELLASWSEKATCYRWLHSRSEKLYRRRNYTFTIPVIILSTLTGTANFAMDSFVPPENKKTAMAAVGGVNIFAGILSTLQNFLRYAELMESHRLSELQWSKFARNIQVELALEPKRRKSAHDFLKISRAEYDRLIEQSPSIDDSIIQQFKHAFKNIQIDKPDACNGLHKCKIYKLSKEEKAAEMMANVTEKLNKRNKDKPVMYDHKHQSIKELNSLMGLGRVSQFKKNKGNVSPTGSVVEEINEIKVMIDETPRSKGDSDEKTEDILPENNADNQDLDIENPPNEDEFLDGIK